MSETKLNFLQGQVVEDEVQLSLVELCRACGAPAEQVTIWVQEGVLEPAGEGPQDWRFGGYSLRRTRLAMRIFRDLDLNPAGVAVALDLLGKIASLEAKLQRLEKT